MNEQRMGRRQNTILATASFLLTTAMAVISAPGAAQGFNVFSCTPTSMFSPLSMPTELESQTKLSRFEFNDLAITPSGEPFIEKGRELNVVVDVQCLHDPALGAKELPWLKNLSKVTRDLRSMRQHSFVWKLEEDVVFSQLQTVFENEPCVKIVAPNSIFFLNATYADPMVTSQSHLGFLHFDEALQDFYEPMLARKKVVIAVIDSGVDFTHPDLYSNRWLNVREVSGNGLDDDQNGYVDDVNGYNFASQIGSALPEGNLSETRHGTHVAGLAASRFDNQVGLTGINGVAKIMSLNIFGANSTTRSAILENAIRYAADNGADVINMSLGGREYSRSMRAVLEYAVSRGAFIVTAAGNYGMEICDNPESFAFVSPAVYSPSISGMMVSGSVDASTGVMSVFSNYSSTLVEIVAPGAFSSVSRTGLISTVPGAEYATLAGTSMSAPVVSGAASLVVMWLKTYGYDSNPQRVENILRASALRKPFLVSSVQEGRSLDLMAIAHYLKTYYPAR